MENIKKCFCESIYVVINYCSINTINGKLEINDIEQKSNAVYISLLFKAQRCAPAAHFVRT